MRLSILGHAGSYGAPGAQCSSYLASGAGTHVLLDIGNGSFSNLLKFMLPGDLSAVFVSHAHHDHFADLVSLYHYLKFVPGAHRGPIPLLASRETLAALRSTIVQDFGDILVPRLVEEGESVRLGALSAAFYPTEHITGTLAVRVRDQEGVSMVYTADTGPSEQLVNFSAGADLLLGESTWLSRPKEIPSGLHMDSVELAELARRAHAKRVVVTHVAYPGNSFAAARLVQERFAGDVMAAFDGLAIEF